MYGLIKLVAGPYRRHFSRPADVRVQSDAERYTEPASGGRGVSIHRGGLVGGSGTAAARQGPRNRSGQEGGGRTLRGQPARCAISAARRPNKMLHHFGQPDHARAHHHHLHGQRPRAPKNNKQTEIPMKILITREGETCRHDR